MSFKLIKVHLLVSELYSNRERPSSQKERSHWANYSAWQKCDHHANKLVDSEVFWEEK